MIRRAALALLLLTAPAASAQDGADTVPAATAARYPGTLRLEIDATDVAHGIFRVRETIPVAKGGPMVLLYPQWLPGKHAPRGEIDKLAGLRITAAGREIAWRRDPVDVYAFHIDVPQGAKAIEARFEFVSATRGSQGFVAMGSQAMRLQFHSLSLYPAGYAARAIPVSATVTYPDGWTAVSAVRATRSGATWSYETTDYDTLVDSPVLAGRWFKAWRLSDQVMLDVVADDPAELEATPEQVAAHARVVEQGLKLFGAEPFDHYDFLLSLSNELGGIGLEHQRSTEIGRGPGYFRDWAARPSQRDVIAHEYVHSWIGKFRRGADIATPDFRAPMGGSLLWVYEGLTQFWGNVLAARAGLVTAQEALDSYAATLATLEQRAGRSWRPLADTTMDPIITPRAPKPWVSWQRSEDYYTEGLLVWMEIDSILRRESRGKRSIDDFTRAFFAPRPGDPPLKPYTQADLIAALDQTVRYDWAGLLDRRLNRPSERAPAEGFAANGYRLVYTDEPTPYFTKLEQSRGQTDLAASLGLTIDKDGDVTAVVWDSPAFAAGITNAHRIVAVNDLAYSDARLKDAVRASSTARDPIRLLVRDGERFRAVSISYRGGARYPRLERIGSGAAALDRLLAPR